MSLFYQERDTGKPKQSTPPAIEHKPVVPSSTFPNETLNNKAAPSPADLKGQFSHGQHDGKGEFDRKESVLIGKDEPEEKGCCARWCGWTSLDYYKDYFKVTSTDVMRRSLSNLKFWDGNFFVPPTQEYDLYGPFWLQTTLIFVLSAVHNVFLYTNVTPFSYDFQIIGYAFSLIYGFGFIFSSAFACVLKCVGVDCKVVQLVCIYGYSIFTTIICVLLCVINIEIMTWVFLGYACLNKIVFLTTNLKAGFEIPASKQIFITLIVAIEAAIQVALIKIVFLSVTATPQATAHATTSASLHVRTFSQ